MTQADMSYTLPPLSAAPISSPIPVLIPSLPKAQDIAPYLKRIDDARHYSNNGPLWNEFREGLAAWLSQRAGGEAVHLVPTNSGTAAIEIALRARAMYPRRLCLMPSFTFVASAHAVCNAGLEPFLLDVDESTLALTPELVIGVLDDLPEAPAAVLVISAFGAPPDILEWEAFERNFGIPVIFDAAAAVTSLHKIGHQPLCVSLHATKVFGIGEGGAVIAADRMLIERLVAMTGFGFTGTDRLSSLRGGNYRISEYAAAVGLATLEGIDAKEQRLRAVGALYAAGLAGRESRLQVGAGTEWATMTLNVIVPDREVDATIARLDRVGAQWRRWWGLGTHRHPAFTSLQRSALPVTERLAPRVIGVPFYGDLTEDQVGRVVSCFS